MMTSHNIKKKYVWKKQETLALALAEG